MSKRFIRTDSSRFSKLGKNRKKLQKWRRAKGVHSKIRNRRTGYPLMPAIGFGSSRKESGKILGFIPVLVENMSDLIKIKNHQAAILSSRLGAKKKIEIIKKADEMKIKILNLNGDKK